jgi:preprotein translocase subunit YajC
MTTWFALTTLYAAADSGAAGGKQSASDPYFVPMMVIVFAAFWYFILYKPMKREKARQANLLAAIKKNDRVLTTGGIYGVVANVNKEANEVTLRVDESSGAKIRVTFNSIAQVLGDEPAADASSK